MVSRDEADRLLLTLARERIDPGLDAAAVQACRAGSYSADTPG